MTKEEQLKYININFPLIIHKNSNRRIRHNFFSKIKTELQSYLLGFYTADGSIDMKRKTFRIHLSEKDKELVYLYKDTIGPDSRIFTYSPHITTGRNQSIVNAGSSIGVDINSTTIVNDLVNLGIGSNKTYTEIHIPKIDQNLISHYIRGIFDGDGCITGWISKEINKKDRFRYSFDICSKTKTILEEIQNIFVNNDIFVNLNYIKRDDMYRLKTSNKNMIYKLFNYLYSDANFYLFRKYNKFKYYVNTETIQLLIDSCNAQDLYPKSTES